MNKEEFTKQEGSVFPGKTYVDALLKPVFYDQRDYLFQAMFQIHRAHVIMLSEQTIIKKEDANIILECINRIGDMDVSSLDYSPDFEDLFFMMESKISKDIGPDLACMIHIARSRNDMGEAMYRIVLRECVLSLLEDMIDVEEALIQQANEHLNTVMTAHTHTQPAQPTTFGHYLLAVFDVLDRDLNRFWSAFHCINLSPMGAAAITTTGFKIDRERVCDLLGFDGLMENSYDAIGGVDYLLEPATSILASMTNTGRWINDFLRLATVEIGIVKVAAPYVQISSIMPQKRNPVSVEHARALASSAVGEALSVIQMIHNTPYGDIVDTEDDLQPHLYRGFDKASRVYRLMNAVVRTMEVDKDRAEKQASENCITITECADVLTREKGVSYREAYKVSSIIATTSVQDNRELSDWNVADVNELLKKNLSEKVVLTKEEWEGIVSPKVFVERRSVRGGPNPSEVKRMIEDRKGKWKNHKEKCESLRAHFIHKENVLKHFRH
ncbi:argininosuccinate lyase [Guptibacillus algicola]|uniref:argininosuccinate lyase n=1 Tax=Guptibacillus algicola TaxID=225844 RepID=UPI001CD67CAF|nr:argininosuccinate lyase [Alkalihalobacillus algicola]MCA0987583.1 argininosuccinate lyase [Alkalihalobacillus algicola]